MAAQWVKIDGYAEFQFETSRYDTGAATDADATPTFIVYEENSDTSVASGNAAKRDDAGTTGHYYARFQCTTAAGFEVGKKYFVRAAATVNSVAGAGVIGEVFVIPATVFDALFGGTDNLQVDAVQVEGTDATDQIAAAAGAGVLDTPANLLATDASGQVTVGAMADDSLTAAALKADAVAEIQTGLPSLTDIADVKRLTKASSPHGWFRQWGRYVGNPLDITCPSPSTSPAHPHVFRLPASYSPYTHAMLFTPVLTSNYELPCILLSDDEGATWVEGPITNPILSAGAPGSWNEHYMPDPDMVYVPEYGLWFLVTVGYGTYMAQYEGVIGLATSPDLVNWTWYAGAGVDGLTAPVILSGRGTTGQEWELRAGAGSPSYIKQPTIIFNEGTFYLYYNSQQAGTGTRSPIGLVSFTYNEATGNIENYARHPSSPLYTIPEDDQFYEGCGHIDVVRTHSGFLMSCTRETKSYPNTVWYNARLLTGFTYTGWLLTSVDGITWTDLGIALRPGPIGAWDEFAIHRWSFLTDAERNLELHLSKLRIYYSGEQRGSSVLNFSYAIGFAESEGLDEGVRQTLADELSGLNDLSSTEAQAAAAAALAAYGAATVSDLVSASDIADAVWNAAARTLTSFGFAVTVGTNDDKTGYSLAVTPPTASEVATAVWSATVRTLSAFGFSVTVSDKTGFSLTAEYDAAKTAAQAGDEMALSSTTEGQIDNIETMVEALGEEIGTGTNVVQVTVVNAESVPLTNARVFASATEGGLPVARALTNAAGLAVINLNDGVWWLQAHGLTGYTHDPEEVTISTDPQAVTLTMTAFDPGTPDDPTLRRVCTRLWNIDGSHTLEDPASRPGGSIELVTQASYDSGEVSRASRPMETSEDYTYCYLDLLPTDAMTPVVDGATVKYQAIIPAAQIKVLFELPTDDLSTVWLEDLL